jgi:hypothetical protein
LWPGKVDRKRQEAKDNWQATFEIVRRPGRYLCLMRTVPNLAGQVGYYWHEPDHQGMFAAGATSTFLGADDLRREVANGFLLLVTGAMPEGGAA